MGTHLDTMLKNTARNHLNNFFSSLQEGGASLGSFLSSLSMFSDTVRTHHDKIEQPETLAVIHNFASLVDNISSSLIQLERESEKLHGIVAEVSTILDDRMGSLTINDERTGSNKASSRDPAYLKPSYEWLLANLDNPYPSKQIKRTIARDTNCSTKDIDAWFTDARRRIGWNKLRKTCFDNKQERIVAAARTFFKAPLPTAFLDDPNASLLSDMDPNDAYRSHFALMQQTAYSLYSNRFPSLVAMSKLNNNRMESPVSSVKASTSATQKVSHNDQMVSQHAQMISSNDLLSSYPTPQPSPAHQEELSSLSSFDTFDISPQCNIRKRRYSTGPQSEADTEQLSNRAIKRLRYEYLDVEAAASLPSPAESTDLSDDGLSIPDCTAEAPFVDTICMSQKHNKSTSTGNDRGDAIPAKPSSNVGLLQVADSSLLGSAPASSTGTEVTLRKRKRRLSDSEGQGPSKRLHNALCLPRLQTVSNPFPLPNLSPEDSLQDWLEDLNSSEQDFCTITLPAILDDYLSGNNSLEVCSGHYGGLISQPELSIDNHFSNFAFDDLTRSLCHSDSWQSFSGLVDPYLKDTQQDYDIPVSEGIVPECESLISTLGHNLPVLSKCLPCHENPQALITEWSTYFPSHQTNAHSQILPTTSIESVDTKSNSSDAKRAKIRALNAQIRRLEAEL